MLRGRFGDTTTTPFIEASVHFPRLDLRGYVSFFGGYGRKWDRIDAFGQQKIGRKFQPAEKSQNQ
jgi:hypothetical protein